MGTEAGGAQGDGSAVCPPVPLSKSSLRLFKEVWVSDRRGWGVGKVQIVLSIQGGDCSLESGSDSGDWVVALRVKGAIGLRQEREWQLRRRCLLEFCPTSKPEAGPQQEFKEHHGDSSMVRCLVDMVTHNMRQMPSTHLEAVLLPSRALYESPAIKLGA